MCFLLFSVTVVGFEQEVYMVSEADPSVTLTFGIIAPDPSMLFTLLDPIFFMRVDVEVLDGTAVGQFCLYLAIFLIGNV